MLLPAAITERGAEHRCCRGVPREGGAGVVHHRRDDHQEQPGDLHRHDDAPGQVAQRGDGDRQQGAGQQLPGTRRQRVERPRRVGVGEPHARRRAEHPQADDDDRELVTEPAGEAGQRPDQERPQQVELLLHGERPEVQQRRLGEVGVEVAAVAVCFAPAEHVVDEEPAGRHGVACQVAEQQRVVQPLGGDERRHDDQARRRQQAAGPTGPEVGQCHGPGAGDLAEQQRGDQEAGDDEEHVDTDEPPAERADVGVEQHHQHHGDGPQALDVGAEADRRQREPFGGDRCRRSSDQRVDLPEWRARCGLFCQLNSWMPDDSRRERQ